MEEAAAVRRAALDAVGDVEPEGLRERIQTRLDEGSVAPGVLTVVSARTLHESRTDAGEFASGPVTERGAGVQLIYEGLRLTRTLAGDPPWERGRSLTDGAGDAADVPADPGAGRVAADALTDADMAILVADVLVARGFYLLARTEAAPEAVATVREFGRDQTVRRTGGGAVDRNLERDVFELAAVAGTTAVGGDAPPALREFVADLAETAEPLPLADGLFTEATLGELARHLEPADSGVASSDD